MIRVVVELWPKGEEAKKRELASLTISNVSKHPPDDATPDDYEVEAFESAYGRTPEARSFAGFDHRRGAGVLALVRAAIEGLRK